MRKLLCLVVGVVVLGAASAQGALINDYLQYNGMVPTMQTIDDKSAERLVKGTVNGTTNLGLPGIIEVGDYLETALKFRSLNSQEFGAGTGEIIGAQYELTAYSILKVKTKDPTSVVGLYDFAFESGFGGGRTIKLYESNVGSLKNFARDDISAGVTGLAWSSASPLGVQERATDGTLITTFGFGEADDFWIARNAPDAMAYFKTVGTTVSAGNFSFGQSVLSNPGNLRIVNNGMDSDIFPTKHAIVGSGELWGIKNINTPADAFNSIRGSFMTVVPEPASVAVWGLLAAIGMVAAGCRRKAR